MKYAFARQKPAEPPSLRSVEVELPTPVRVPVPQGKPLWSVALVIGLMAMVGGMVWMSFAGGARSFTGAGSLFPIMMVGGLFAMLFSGRGSQDMSRAKLDALRARYCLTIDEKRDMAATAADRLGEHYRWYHPAPQTLESALGGVRMWERTADGGADSWFGVVRVGVGMTDLQESAAAVFREPEDMPSDIELEPVTGKVLQEFVRYQTVAYGVPALVSLMVEPGYELRGPRERVLALMRAVLCQLVFWHGPDHLRLVVVTADVPEWDWVKWLPHVGDPVIEDGAGPVRMVYGSVADFVEAQADAMGLRGRGEFVSRHKLMKTPIDPLPHTVIVCDVEGGWEVLGNSAGVSGITFFDLRGCGEVPACAEPARVLHVREDAVVTAVPRDPKTWDALPDVRQFFAVADQMSRDEAEVFAERMARWRLAEAYESIEVNAASRFMARDILAHYGIDDPANIDFERLWESRSDINNSAQRLKVPIGNRADNNELLFLDLKQSAEGGIGPHGVMVGTTGSGKTTMLRALIESLMLGHPPQNLQFLLADLKGGAGVKPFAGVPHVAQIITDLEEDQNLLGRFVEALWGEIARRKALCDLAEADDANMYNMKRADQLARGDADPLPPLPVLMVVIDEFAELYRIAADIDEVLIQLCRQGRAYWVHLLMASQELGNRAEKLINNMGYKIPLALNSKSDAALVGVPNAIHLPKNGQAYLAVGDSLVRFQGEYLWREYRKPGTEDFTTGEDAVPASVNYFAPQLFGTDFTPLPLPDDFDEDPAQDSVEEPARDEHEAEAADSALMRPQVGRVIIDELRRVRFEPYRLWQPPLDAPWTIERLVDTFLGRRWDTEYAARPNLVFPIGLVDRPFKHDQHPLVVDVSGPGANVVIVGAQGSGKTTALQDLICAAAMTHTPEQVQFYCLAFSSAALATVAGLPHVGAVAQALDGDGVRRTVAEMAELLASRKRSFEQAGVMSMEVFRRRKSGQEDAEVPADGYGDVFLVIDNYGALNHAYEALMDTVDRLILEGPTFGIHVVAAVNRPAELRIHVRGAFGSRVWLRPNEIHDVTDLPKPRLAAAIPADRPGRGMIAQNYSRLGSEPGGLHTLMARPALAASAAEDFDSRSVAEAVSRVASGFTAAPRVRRLPARLSPASLRSRARGDARYPSSIVWALSETESPVFFDTDSHLVIAGQAKCGRTTVCATVLSEIARLYSLDGAGEKRGRPAAQVWLVDPRRQLHGVLGPAGVYRFASTVDGVKNRMAELASVLAARLPQDDPDSGGQIMARSWQGPEIFLVIDDAERIPAGFDSPLAVMEPFVQVGSDVGFHIIYTQAFGSFSSGIGANPMLRALRQSSAPMLIMDSDPEPGPVWHKWKGHPMIPGRGFLINSAESGEAGIYVQVADTEVAKIDPQ